MGRKAGLLGIGAGVDCRDGRTTPSHTNAQLADPSSLNSMTQVAVRIGRRYFADGRIQPEYQHEGIRIVDAADWLSNSNPQK